MFKHYLSSSSTFFSLCTQIREQSYTSNRMVRQNKWMRDAGKTEQLTIAVCLVDSWDVTFFSLLLSSAFVPLKRPLWNALFLVHQVECILVVVATIHGIAIFTVLVIIVLYKLCAWLCWRNSHNSHWLYLDESRSIHCVKDKRERKHNISIHRMTPAIAIAITCGALSYKRIYTPLNWTRLEFLQHSSRLDRIFFFFYKFSYDKTNIKKANTVWDTCCYRHVYITVTLLCHSTIYYTTCYNFFFFLLLKKAETVSICIEN